MRNLIIGLFLLTIIGIAACTKNNSQGFSGSPNGQGGSLARFTVVGDYLYTIDRQDLGVFDISNASQPVFVRKVSIGFEIETIFPFKNKLFIASTTAMFIYNIDQPATPVRESFVEHFTGCDPVVANDSVAFLTIRGGNACGSNLNVLNIYDIRNIRFPQLLNTVEMANPYGLGMQDSVLYVCDNGAGLRILDIKNPAKPSQIGVLTGESFVDVIPAGNLLIGMLRDGIAYLDISDPTSPQLLSTIKN